MTKIINLTPHTITIKTEAKTYTIEPSGIVARVDQVPRAVGYIGDTGITYIKYDYTDVKDLPEPYHDTIYLVSSIVLAAIKGRDDVYAPDTSSRSVMRDEKGNIIAVKNLVKGG
mgnify:CR=1 FL=1